MIYFDMITEEVRRRSPSYGLSPYYLKEVSVSDLPVLSVFNQQDLPSYIGIYLYEDYNRDDLMHHFEHSREFLQMPEASRADFILFQTERFASEAIFLRWKFNQAAIAIGIALGYCEKIGLRATVVQEGSRPTEFVGDSCAFCLIEVHC